MKGRWNGAEQVSLVAIRTTEEPDVLHNVIYMSSTLCHKLEGLEVLDQEIGTFENICYRISETAQILSQFIISGAKLTSTEIIDHSFDFTQDLNATLSIFQYHMLGVTECTHA